MKIKANADVEVVITADLLEQAMKESSPTDALSAIISALRYFDWGSAKLNKQADKLIVGLSEFYEKVK